MVLCAFIQRFYQAFSNLVTKEFTRNNAQVVIVVDATVRYGLLDWSAIRYRSFVLLRLQCRKNLYEPGHSIFYKIACAHIEDSDQPVHMRSLIRVFAGHSLGSQVTKASFAGQRRPWSACTDWSESFAERTINLVGNTVPRLWWFYLFSCTQIHSFR